MAGIKPITGMPANHPLVNGDLENKCPGSPATLNVGDPIPETWSWSNDGTCSEFENMNVHGAKMFYGFNWPIKSSANTGYYKVDATVMYFMENAVGDMYLIITVDAPKDAIGTPADGNLYSPGDTTSGRMFLDVKMSPPTSGVQLVFLDDPAEYALLPYTQRIVLAAPSAPTSSSLSLRDHCFAHGIVSVLHCVCVPCVIGAGIVTAHGPRRGRRATSSTTDGTPRAWARRSGRDPSCGRSTSAARTARCSARCQSPASRWTWTRRSRSTTTRSSARAIRAHLPSGERPTECPCYATALRRGLC